MSKARKSKANPAPAAQSAGPQPLRGIEKAAFWSVPAVGAIGLLCASTIGVMFFSRPTAVATLPKPAPPAVVNKVDPPKAEPKTTLTSGDATAKTETTPKATDEKPKTTEDRQKIGAPIPFAETTPEPAAVADPPAPKIVGPVSVGANTTMSLTCSTGTISFEGKRDIVFVDQQPSLEISKEGGVEFACLSFDGVEQSAELSPISRAQGSIEIVTLMPDKKTSVILDTNFQRMTLRKNRDGLRWRIGGKKKPAKIRLIPNPVNFNQWHHIMLTWKNGGDAIVYVDGVEQDRYPYVHEQPHFGDFQKVVLGRTRAPGSRYYESRVNKLVVYDQPISAAKVAELNQSVRQTYPFIFK